MRHRSSVERWFVTRYAPGTGFGVAGRQRVVAAARKRVGHPPDGRALQRTAPAGTGQAPPLQPDHRRRTRLPALRTGCGEPVHSARLVLLRIVPARPHAQVAVLRLGHRLRRPSRRCAGDRPLRSPRRRPHTQSRQVPAPRPRRRQPAQHPDTRHGKLWTRQPVASFSSVATAPDSSVVDTWL